MDLDEVCVLTHQVEYSLVFLAEGHVECLDRDFRQAQQWLEDVVVFPSNYVHHAQLRIDSWVTLVKAVVLFCLLVNKIAFTCAVLAYGRSRWAFGRPNSLFDDFHSFLTCTIKTFRMPFFLIFHHPWVPFRFFQLLFLLDDGLQEILGILVLPPIGLILIAQGVTERQWVLQHAISRALQLDLVLDDDLDELELIV